METNNFLVAFSHGISRLFLDAFYIIYIVRVYAYMRARARVCAREKLDKKALGFHQVLLGLLVFFCC